MQAHIYEEHSAVLYNTFVLYISGQGRCGLSPEGKWRPAWS